MALVTDTGRIRRCVLRMVWSRGVDARWLREEVGRDGILLREYEMLH